MSHPGHVHITRFACAAEDPAPALEEVLGTNPSSMLLGEIYEELNARWAKLCLRRVLHTDPRFARVGPDRYVLRTAHVIEYRGLVEEMRTIVRHENVITVSDLAAQLGAAFGVEERDVRRAAWQRPFACANGVVQLAVGDCAPSLWSVPAAFQQSLVQVKGGFVLDTYITVDDLNSQSIEVDGIVASLLRLSEETDTGVPVTATADCGDDAEIRFWWDGGHAWVHLPQSFLTANPLQADHVLRMHFHGNAGHIRSVSLHVLPASVAIEQRLLHQRVAQEPLFVEQLNDALVNLVEAAKAKAMPNRGHVVVETIRLAIEALLQTSRDEMSKASGDSDDAEQRMSRPQGSHPGRGRITIAASGTAGAYDPFIRWRWSDTDQLMLEFALPSDPIREMSGAGELMERMKFARAQDGPLFKFARIFDAGKVTPHMATLLIMRVLRDVIRINSKSLWFIGPSDLAEKAWTQPGDVYPRWDSSTSVQDAVREGVTLPYCLDVPTWLGPFLAKPRLEDRPLVQPKLPMKADVRGARKGPVARPKYMQEQRDGEA